MELKRAVAKLELTGRKAKAAKMLADAIEIAEKEGKLHETYEFEMLYVEMLIYMVIICVIPQFKDTFFIFVMQPS